jgi:epoxyqueuosine reductase QueG
MTDVPGQKLTEVVRRIALESGASLVGFADLEGIADLPRGVAIAMRHSPEVLADPSDMPNPAYSQEYWDLSARLTETAREIAARIESAGYRATALAATRHKIDPEKLAAPFPHKTAATRAGLGWVGKCALLVTYDLGPRVRLGSVLTDAPLAVGEPVTESECGDCTVCVDACPGGAVTGELWYPGRPREEFFDAAACHRTCGERSRARGLEGGRCGVCMAVCPRVPRDSWV